MRLGEISTKEEYGFDSVMPFGKHKGESIIDILSNDIGYVAWLKENNIIKMSDRIEDYLYSIKENFNQEINRSAKDLRKDLDF